MLLLKMPDGKFFNRLFPKSLAKIIQSGVINIVFMNKVQEISMIKNVFQWPLGRNILIVATAESCH